MPSLLCSPTQSFPDSASPLAIGLQSLIETIVLPDAHWVIQNQYKVSREPSSSLVITHSVRIKEDLTWSLSVHGFPVDSLKCGLLSDIPESMCQSSLVKLLNLLDKCNVCPGNPDSNIIAKSLPVK